MSPSAAYPNAAQLPAQSINGTGVMGSMPATTTATGPAATTAQQAAMAISITQRSSNCGSVNNSLTGSMASYKISSSENSWPQAVCNKENQRPPVYNPEDYAQSLKKFSKRHSNNGQQPRSIYDIGETPPKQNATNKTTDQVVYKSSTLPHKHSEYRSPIPTPPKSDSEMSLRQFASITDLLGKLRADLRASFPSFVQEFVAMPSDGVSLLLEVLRAIQLSQATTNGNTPLPPSQMTASMPRNQQTYQRRALLDELACLQCLSVCCSRSMDATTRLGNTPTGLMPLASSATGQGIRARILALQLMTAACDKTSLCTHDARMGGASAAAGHTAVSEAMSTLRLRCSEPVRFRLLVGMLNSGGGSGELQAVGVKFLNTFLSSAVELQQRLYVQAELFQAGFEPASMTNGIAVGSPWLDALRSELKRFSELYVDVDKMLTQARDAERVRNQMVILERRVQILHEEKAVLTSMERRLQERCAELQREIFRIQGAARAQPTAKGDDAQERQQPVALPRCHKPTAGGKHGSKQDGSSEHEDEGISSSETGPSLSPVPILSLPTAAGAGAAQPKRLEKDEDGATVATIEDVMEELADIVHEAEKEFCAGGGGNATATASQFQPIRKAKFTTSGRHGHQPEKEIVPVNIVPQPPRKSRSLAHLVSQPGGSELDGSDYALLMPPPPPGAMAGGLPLDTSALERVAALQTFFDETDGAGGLIVDTATAAAGILSGTPAAYTYEPADVPEVNAHAVPYNASTTRELLDVIMNARHSEHDPTMAAFCSAAAMPGNDQMHHHGGGAATLNRPSRRQRDAPPPPHPPLAAATSSSTTVPMTAFAAQTLAPAQQFNGVFFRTDMNAPPKWPKPDLTAALQARRVSKNVERLEAVFAHDNSNNSQQSSARGHQQQQQHSAGSGGQAPAAATREKSRSNHQIYFGSNPGLRATGNNNYTTYTPNSISAGPALGLGGGVHGAHHDQQMTSQRTRTHMQGSKVTDIPSGMY